MNWAVENLMMQWIDCETRFSEKDKPSRLDLLFTSDKESIETINECPLTQYADNTQFLHADNVNNLDLISKTGETLWNIKQYFLRSGRMLNSKKTHCICIGTT